MTTKSNIESNELNDSLSVYNEQELNYLDKYLPIVQNAFDEEELYEIILDCNFNDQKIGEKIREKQKWIKAKGSIYGWNVVKSNHRVKPVDANEHLKKEKQDIEVIINQEGQYQAGDKYNKSTSGRPKKYQNNEEKYDENYEQNYDENYYSNWSKDGRYQNYSHYYNNDYQYSKTGNKKYQNYDDTNEKNYRNRSYYNNYDKYNEGERSKKYWNSSYENKDYYKYENSRPGYSGYPNNNYNRNNYGNYSNSNYSNYSNYPNYSNYYYQNYDKNEYDYSNSHDTKGYYGNYYQDDYSNYDNTYYKDNYQTKYSNTNFQSKYKKKRRPNNGYNNYNYSSYSNYSNSNAYGNKGYYQPYVEFKDYIAPTKTEEKIEKNEIDQANSKNTQNEEKLSIPIDSKSEIQNDNIDDLKTYKSQESNNYVGEKEKKPDTKRFENLSKLYVFKNNDYDINSDKKAPPQPQNILTGDSSEVNQENGNGKKSSQKSNEKSNENNEEIEEINVNKTNMDNLRNYFERLKQKTVFNEVSQPNGSNFYNSGLYEKFSNYTGINRDGGRPIKNSDTGNSNNFIQLNEGDKKSKLLTNLSIISPLEMTFSGQNFESLKESVSSSKQIENFSITICGKEKTTQDQNNLPNISQQAMTNTPYQSAHFPYSQYDYANYMNQPRYLPYQMETPGHVETEFYPNYDYQYGYYQYPYRTNPQMVPYQTGSNPMGYHHNYQDRSAYAYTPEAYSFPYGMMNPNIYYQNQPMQYPPNFSQKPSNLK